MKNKLLIIFSIVLVFIFVSSALAISETTLLMPLIFKGGVYFDTPIPTSTSTPKPPPPPPTATPTYQWAEGGNTCVHVWGARDNPWGEGMLSYGQVASVCTILVVDRWEQNGKLLVVRGHRIKTDTYGCQKWDFGPLVSWPPIDYECPPPTFIPPSDEWGQMLWGDIEELYTLQNAKTICGYCEECEYGTWNCKDITEFRNKK